MSMFLKDATDIENLRSAIKKCEGEVLLRSCDGSETFNMKSKLSEFMAIGALCSKYGDQYEFFCMNKNDEGYLMEFFIQHKI